VVTWALEAGAEIVGTVQCENWCQSTSSSSGAQGAIENSHAKGYFAGGSTSGTTALVGTGIVGMAIGADHWPTHGLAPYTGFGSNDAINGKTN
jgi:amidase